MDIALGLSSLSWVVLGLLDREGPPMAARLGAALVNGTVALLFFTRQPARVHTTTKQFLRALPSVLTGAVAWRLSGTDWPLPLAIAFLITSVCASLTLLSLGRSFAIFPSLRTLKERGPYAVVRHPLYALEVLLVVASASAFAWWAGLALGALTLTLLVVRIRDEEEVLSADPQYAAYCAQVRWRLLPGIY